MIRKIVVSYGPTYYKSIELRKDGKILFAGEEYGNEPLDDGTFINFFEGWAGDSLIDEVYNDLMTSGFFELREDSSYFNTRSINSKYSLLVQYDGTSKKVIGDDFPESFSKFLINIFKVQEGLSLEKVSAKYKFETSADVWPRLPEPVNIN